MYNHVFYLLCKTKTSFIYQQPHLTPIHMEAQPAPLHFRAATTSIVSQNKLYFTLLYLTLPLYFTQLYFTSPNFTYLYFISGLLQINKVSLKQHCDDKRKKLHRNNFTFPLVRS